MDNKQTILLELMKHKYEEETETLENTELEIKQRVDLMELVIKNLGERGSKSDISDCTEETLKAKSKNINDQNQAAGFFRGFLNKTKSILSVCSEVCSNRMDEAPVQDKCKCNKTKGDRKSLQREDLNNLTRIQELANKEKLLTSNIDELWRREKTLGEMLRNFKKQSDLKCICNFANPNIDHIFKENEDLKIRNATLKLELENMTADIKEQLQKMELPTQFELQNRKIKNRRLEQSNLTLSHQIKQMRDENDAKMDELKMQLSQQRVKAKEISQENKKLQESITDLSTKIDKYRELIHQHETNSGEMTDAVKNFLQSKLKKPTIEEEPCDIDLETIAQKLSKALADFEPCADCTTLLPELGTAAKYIKELTRMVDNKIKEKKFATDEEFEEKHVQLLEYKKDAGELPPSATSLEAHRNESIESAQSNGTVEDVESIQESESVKDVESIQTAEELNTNVTVGKRHFKVKKEELVNEISEKVVQQVKDAFLCICFKAGQGQGIVKEEPTILKEKTDESEAVEDTKLAEEESSEKPQKEEATDQKEQETEPEPDS